MQNARNFGHEATLVTENPDQIPAIYRIEGLHIVASPLQHEVKTVQPWLVVNFASILWNIGVGDPHFLTRAIGKWRDFLNALQPDTVVFQSAPLAMLATRHAPFKRFNIGMGHEIPPAITPLPPMRPWISEPKTLAHQEQIVLRSVNHALIQNKLPPLVSLASLTKCDANFLITNAALDHYRSTRGTANYLGPIYASVGNATIRWISGQPKRILLYLRRRQTPVESILTQLNALDAEVIAVVPDATPDMQALIKRPTLRLIADSVDFAPLLDDTTLAISYAGHGFVSACLAAGVPLILLPSNLEQFILARHLAAQNFARLHNPAEIESLFAVILQSINDATIRRAAQAYRHQYRHQSVEKTVRGIIQRLELAIEPTNFDGRRP